MKHLLIVIFCILFSPLCAYAQQTKEVEETVHYEIPRNISDEQAERIVCEMAMNIAIEKAFGKSFGKSDTGVTHTVNGKTSEFFYSNQESALKGMWIETISGPNYSYGTENGKRYVDCHIKGIVREITSHVNFTAKILRKKTKEDCEDNVFNSNDKVYLHFTSPTDGYLAVYLYSPEDEKVYCLLPYPFDKHGIKQIQHDTTYIFFSQDHASEEEEEGLTDLKLICERDVVNEFYIIFSPNKFTKVNDKPLEDNKYFRYIDYKSFNKWLNKVRCKDNDMQVQRKCVTIRPKEID